MTPLVSAIVPAYNVERFFTAAIESALAQTLRDSEIIVTDDGSTDGTSTLADQYAAAHPDRIKVVHQNNGGLVAARNAAMAVARGRYLALLDADDAWLPHHLEASVDVMEREPDIGLVHANCENMDVEGHSLGAFGKKWPPSANAFLEILLRRSNVACCTAVFRRAVVDEVGPFDLMFNRLGCEDRDMWLRIAKVAGLRHLDSVHSRYRIHGNNMSSNLLKMQQARLLVVAKHTVEEPGRSWKRQAIAAVHNLAGEELLCDGKRLRALAAFLKALAWNPRMPKAWRGAAASVLRPLPRLNRHV